MSVPLTSEANCLYLDACATTPVGKEVLEAMAIAQAGAWANPSSLHGFGLVAADSLERSRGAICSALGAADHSLIFTSGGTESLHLALLGATQNMAPGRLLISAVEHPALVSAAAQLAAMGWLVEEIPVDREGLVDLNALHPLLAPPTRLVSIIWGQSEVGTIQPIEAIGELCRAGGVLFHTDAVQLVGHQGVNFHGLPIDLLSLTAHKIGGPRGIGALMVRQGVEIKPLLGGGAQEFGLRSGTESVVLAAGFAAAMAELIKARQLANSPKNWELRDSLMEALEALPGVQRTGPAPGRQRLPHHISLVLKDRSGQPISGREMVRALWRQGLAVSSGSACSSGKSSPSPVLLAMGYGADEAASGLRISLGPWLTEPEVVLARVPEAVLLAMAELQ
ncbi:cysteine desulfurase family protein [Cyanobium sp. WAJ14-Wanaka]|uniref:cysteine desulfurase family protein n=1 Tax=Cyanobium sp. WAJ14-Wanaka TaxID=2823725 RepID=UPI0020CC511F|nr:cysteine desulfurase family protein [Cyanobium sp. WAJ14-Wanaka]MCP9774524.1 cysteine desulfurase [Cyanobium sp. WAJ14-Wanaka]